MAKNDNDTKASPRDIYQEVTDTIVQQLEQGTRPWVPSWGSGAGGLPLRSNGETYRGINIPLLWGTMTAKGYTNPYFFTFKQAQELGAMVRKGEKSTRIVYANSITKDEVDAETGEATEKSIAFLKSYSVFNAAQIDGLPAKYYPADQPEKPLPERLHAAEAYFAATGAKVQHGGDRAYFSPKLDLIQLPPAAAFTTPEAYAATKGHEFIHWSGHESRLARDLKNRFGSSEYANEELVAEMGAAFLCARLGVSPEVRSDHAEYLASWLKALKDDKRLIFKAAAAAQKAVEHLDGYQPKAELTAGVAVDRAPQPAETAPTIRDFKEEAQKRQAAYEATRANWQAEIAAAFEAKTAIREAEGPAPSPHTLYTSDPVRIGQTDWRLMIFTDDQGNPVEEYEYRDTRDGPWSDEDQWPRYDAKAADKGLPKELFILRDANRAERIAHGVEKPIEQMSLNFEPPRPVNEAAQPAAPAFML